MLMLESGTIAVTVLWMTLFFLFYTYIGYPLLAYLRAWLGAVPIKKDITYAPDVSFIIVVHNEEKVIRRKLENVLSLAYQGKRFEVIVASDGSTDGTNKIVCEYRDRGILLLPFPQRRGKAQVLNKTVPFCSGDIVVLSDARQIYAEDAIRELISNFSDTSVGAVSGNLHFQACLNSKDGEQIGVYWKYEKWIRRLQSERDSTPVVTGAIYALRKSLFLPLPATCIADDLAMPMNIVMQNRRVIFDPAAKAFDNYSCTSKEEFKRRVRTIAGSYQYLIHASYVLNPQINRIWFDFISHKVCRIIAPFGLIALLISNLIAITWPYWMLLVSQITFYTMAGLGAILAHRGGGMPRLFSVPFTFLMLNAAASVALFKLMTGSQTHLWEKSERLG